MNRPTRITTVIGMTMPDTDGAATSTPSTAESTEMAGVIMLSPRNSEAPKIPSAASIAFARRPPGRARRRIRAMSAMIPPSPSLSARMMSTTYVRVTMIVTDQKISETAPKMLSRDTLTGCGSLGSKRVCTVYNGLVPMSPKTTPRAPSARAPCAVARRLTLKVSAPLSSRYTRVGTRVCGQPLVYQRVSREAAHAVARHRDQERLPVQGQSAQRLVRHDRGRPRDAAEQRDLPEAVAGPERCPWLSPDADPGGSGHDQVEQLADLPLTHHGRARLELMRLEVGREELDHGQRQRREHGQPLEQFYLLTGSGHRLVEPHEAPHVGQGQDSQAAAQQGQRATNAEGVQAQRCGDRSGAWPGLGHELGRP